MNYSQEQLLQQKLVMTQEMMQSLEILQVSAVELKGIIDREQEENPLIEVVEEHSEQVKSDVVEQKEEFNGDDETEYYESNYGYGNSEDNERDMFSNIAADETDAVEKFIKDLRNESIDDNTMELMEYIVDGVDEKGFFSENIAEAVVGVSTVLKRDITEDEFERVRKIVANFDNRGIASKNISEYLLIKISENVTKEMKNAAEKVLTQCFEEFTRKKLKEIVKKTGIKEDVLRELYMRVSKLEPYPLRGCDAKSDKSQVMVPDVIVKEEEGEFEVYLNDRFIPEIRLNNEYYKTLAQDKEAVEYLKEKVMRFRNLEKSIEQRNLTIFRVASEIVSKQKEFFLRGEKHLKPMILNEIGEELSLHESTISRVVNGKYMQTPRGIFEFKYFFSGKVETSNGVTLSMLAVQKMISEIVDREDTKNPFTDKEICDILVRRGIKISQRTVSNYREAMEILPTYLRKEI